MGKISEHSTVQEQGENPPVKSSREFTRTGKKWAVQRDARSLGRGGGDWTGDRPGRPVLE